MNHLQRLASTLATVTLCSAPASGLAATAVTNCDDINNTDTSLWARSTSGPSRQTFDVVVKASPEGKVQLGRVWNVIVDRKRGGALTLATRQGGAVSGSLSFDSYASPDDPVEGVAPFPANWPGAGNGTLVRVGNLACQLKG